MQCTVQFTMQCTMQCTMRCTMQCTMQCRLNRMNLEEHITAVLDWDTCLPAVAQGAIGIQIRDEDEKMSRCTACTSPAPPQHLPSTSPAPPLHLPSTC